MEYIQYGEQEINYLTKKDPKLGAIIAQFGLIKRAVDRDVFKALVESIISQQISVKAANTVRQNLTVLVGKITPKNIASFTNKQIQGCGMSFRKANYIKELANSVITKQLDLANLFNLSAKEISNQLIKLNGIGKWTVEMLLIHTFLKPDIISYSDLAIKRGLMLLHNLDTLSKEAFNYYQKLYSPYGTVASIYLWELYYRHLNNKL